ncbi:MAG: sigma-70 family RNA polymerase sigma factor [Bacteroidota bacterium]|nr:sigma-70 family RNA polymerase sigma factor [Bacteroidota bacterium]
MQKEVNIDYLLWKRIKAGETQAFHELYLQYADILFSFGSIYSKDQDLVKDCIHDLFFDLYKYRKTLSDNDHIRNYLFKALKRKIQLPKNGKLNLVYSSKIKDEDEHKSTSSDEELLEEKEENLVRIRKAIDRLSDRQQEALNLRFQTGLSYSEIGKILDISVESVRTLVYRSVKTIREELKANNVSLILFFYPDE